MYIYLNNVEGVTNKLNDLQNNAINTELGHFNNLHLTHLFHTHIFNLALHSIWSISSSQPKTDNTYNTAIYLFSHSFLKCQFLPHKPS